MIQIWSRDCPQADKRRITTLAVSRGLTLPQPTVVRPPSLAIDMREREAQGTQSWAVN